MSAAWTPVDDAWAVAAIAHGAGAGYRHPFLVGFAGALHEHGIATLRFNFPYVEAGRRMPGPAAHAVSTWSAVQAWVADHSTAPLWACGKSYGGRMASMAAAEGAIAPAGLIYLGYPLHPPGEPAKARVAHLPDVPQPQLFVGVGIGMLMSIVAYSLVRRRRDFASVMQVVAERYEVPVS